MLCKVLTICKVGSSRLLILHLPFLILSIGLFLYNGYGLTPLPEQGLWYALNYHLVHALTLVMPYHRALPYT
jgi:hypothetical protein